MARRLKTQDRTRNLDAPAWAQVVGRDREIDALADALADARAGYGQLVLVSGEAGIGKTTLLTHLADEAAGAGMRVVWGLCWEGGGAPPFWPWGTIVDELCRGTDPGPFAERLAAIAPELGARLERKPAGPSADAEQARFALLTALVGLLRETVAREPLVLAVDDVHAAGQDALVALEFVARELRGQRLLCVAAYRDEAMRARPDAESLLAGLARTSVRVPLAGLPETEVGRVIELLTGAPPAEDLVHAVSTMSAGNPFFAREIVRTLSAEGELRAGAALPAVQLPLPSGVREAIARRVAPLPDEAQSALAAAAVAGRAFRLSVLQRVTGIERGALAEALEQAMAAGLVTPQPSAAPGFGFVHGLVRETIYARLEAAERRRLHVAVADALEQVLSGELDSHRAQLAHHRFAAAALGADPEPAVSDSAAAGETALCAFAWDEAVRLFEQALAALELGEPDAGRRTELLVRLGHAQAHAGAAEARDTLRSGAEAAAAAGRPDLIALAALDFGSFALSPGILDEELVALLERALDALGPGDDPLRVRVLARLAVALYWSDDVERRLAVADEAVAMARRLGDRATLAYALLNHQGATSSPDRTEECVRTAAELFRLAEASGDPELQLPARVRQIGYLLELDDLPGSDVALETLERLARESQDPRAQAYVPLERSRRLALEGRFEEAERLTAEAARLGARLRDSTIPMQAAAQTIGMRWMQGRMSEVYDQLKRFADGYPAMPVYRAALALACCESGRDADARRELRVLAADGFAGIPRDSIWLLCVAFLAETCRDLGEAEPAAALYDEAARFDRRNVVSPDAIFAGPVSRYLGLLAAARGDWEAADGHLSAAAAQARLDGARPSLCRALHDQAQALLERGRDDDAPRAAALLDEAAALAEELELTALLPRIRAAGERAGPAPAEAASNGEPGAGMLRREGELWRIEYGGRLIHVRDSKGMRSLAVLLAAPGVEIAAGDLEVRAGLVTEAPATADSPLAGLDAEARRAYRERLEDLRDEIEQAEAWSDPERASRAREEMEMIGAELAAAVGLGGRDRPLASSAERARVRVTRTLHSAIKRIGEQHDALGYELDATVHTGTFCLYEPDPRRPVSWRVEEG